MVYARRRRARRSDRENQSGKYKRRRQGEREKTVYLHASLIYAHRPATSDKSLMPRHYLFVCVHARAREFFSNFPWKWYLCDEYKTHAHARATYRHWYQDTLTPRIRGPVRTQTRNPRLLHMHAQTKRPRKRSFAHLYRCHDRLYRYSSKSKNSASENIRMCNFENINSPLICLLQQTIHRQMIAFTII